MELVRKCGAVWVYYLNGAFSDTKFAVVRLRGMKVVGYYKTLKEAEEVAEAAREREEQRMKKVG